MPGLYIHYPYCAGKCSYCDFFSVTETKSEESLQNAILHEIDLYPDYFSMKLDSIFIGGGTPSLADIPFFEKLIGKLGEKFNFSKELEFTIEANPGTLGYEKMKELKNIGINRISFGVQSFNDQELKFLERIHNSEIAIKAIENARNAGFENISFDLMHSFPGQTFDTWLQTLEIAISLDPDHISAYSLICEQGTPMQKKIESGLLKLPDEEMQEKFFIETHRILTDAGLKHYEISNFAKNNEKKCKHNLNYWKRKEYLGIGPSAHGFLAGMRYSNFRNIGKYVQSVENEKYPREMSEILTDQQIIDEIIYLGSRFIIGIDVEKIEMISRKPQPKLIRKIKSFEKEKYLEFNGRYAVPTIRGFLLSDRIAIELSSLLC